MITRWGTWLDAAIYCCEHFETIVRTINLLNKIAAVSIEKAKLCMLTNRNLVYIESNFEI
jgi:hypothetical protein